jgi:hypothetical protein
MENADFNLPEGLIIRKVRSHWLTQRPNASSYMVAGISLMILLVTNLLFSVFTYFPLETRELIELVKA